MTRPPSMSFCARRERAARSGEVVAFGLRCYTVGEFGSGFERGQAGVKTSTETWTARDAFRARLGSDVVGEIAIGGPHLGRNSREGRVKTVRGSGQVMPA
jgi:hypothetical protein